MKALVERDWIQLYDSIEPLKEPLCNHPEEKVKAYKKAYQKAYQKAYHKAYQKTDKWKAYKKAYQKTDKWKAYKKAYQKAYYQRKKQTKEVK